ncbi:hypothetical protein APHAL10511_008404 [Amanita phalloides]|nr:hypothetical protein APHAL10511_008404 [Amanita phalloides]
MAAFPASTIVWLSIRPLLRLVICVLSGFIITKADIFPLVAARSAGQLLLNIAYPCLMFSRIVPAFNASNIHVLGPLVLLAIIYELIGVIIAWLIKQTFWVPHRFRYGLVVAGGWANIGDIPTSVLLSLTSSAPFNSNTDPDLSIAYISAFVLVFLFSLFPLGGHKLVALDYVGPDVESDEVREYMRLKRKSLFRRLSPNPSAIASDKDFECKSSSPFETDIALTQVHARDDAMSSPTEIETIQVDASSSQLKSVRWSTPPQLGVASPSLTPLSSKLLRTARTVITSALIPPSLSILISFPIALIPDLKALFLSLPHSSTHIPNAPDNLPPLYFILDAAQFIGAAAVPLGLICLGSALARLPIPRRGQWHSLPLGAILSLAVGKLVIMPILGALIVSGMVRGGLIDEKNKVLRLVCMYVLPVFLPSSSELAKKPQTNPQVSLVPPNSDNTSLPHPGLQRNRHCGTPIYLFDPPVHVDDGDHDGVYGVHSAYIVWLTYMQAFMHRYQFGV